MITQRARRSAVLAAATLYLVIAPTAHASSIDLFDFSLSTSTGISGDWQDASTSNPTSIIDSTSAIYNNTNCCGDATNGTTTGLGAINYTFNPGAAGTYTVSFYFDYDASTPYYNEYGAINHGSNVQNGISYEIFNAKSTTGNIVLFPTNGVAGGETYGTANDTNVVPGATDNFLNTCTNTAVCNSDVGMALTYTFTLSSDQYAVLSAVASTTDPGGFSLETTHPVDADNNSATSVYLTGSFAIDTGAAPPPVTPPPVTPPPSSVPEPSSGILFLAGLVCLAIPRARRRVRA